MVKVVAHARQKRRPTRRVYVTLKDGLNRKGPTRSLTIYGVTLEQAERKIMSLDEQGIESLLAKGGV